MGDPRSPSLRDSFDDLQNEGFTSSFVFENGHLRCPETGEKFTAEDLKIVGVFRFEGHSDPENMSIVYAIESTSGTKGTVVDAFGTYASPELGDFMEQVRMSRKRAEVQDSVPKSEPGRPDIL